ncbi:hypothetical protein [Halorubellus sp. PRR65]|uniref:hypothetical protein n=1 Tax=Halorubellus sp. PRR65 TaxID=3098148 RepID=UPI002B259CE1|nr:hypothetical protein [Halorubellus sp. PRR65]
MSSTTTNETAVQVSAALVAFAVLIAFQTFGSALNLGNAGATVGAILFNAVVFGGAHLYLAVRGEDGSVPVASRWRLLVALGAVTVAALAAVAFRAPIESATGMGVAAIGYAFFAVVALGYLVLEARSGYLEAMAAN